MHPNNFGIPHLFIYLFLVLLGAGSGASNVTSMISTTLDPIEEMACSRRPPGHMIFIVALAQGGVL